MLYAHVSWCPRTKDRACFCVAPRSSCTEHRNTCWTNRPCNLEFMVWSEANELLLSTTKEKYHKHTRWGEGRGRKFKEGRMFCAFFPFSWEGRGACRTRRAPVFTSTSLNHKLCLFCCQHQFLRTLRAFTLNFCFSGNYSFQIQEAAARHVPTSSLHIRVMHFVCSVTPLSLLSSNDNIKYTPAYSHNILRKY